METSRDTSEATAPEPGAALSSAAERVRNEGRELVRSTRADALHVAAERKDRAAGFVRDVASAVHKGSDELRSRGHGRPAEYVDWAAGGLDELGGGIARHGIEELWDELESFARRRPALFFGAALLVGFGAVRFAMSTQRASGAGRSGDGGLHPPAPEAPHYSYDPTIGAAGGAGHAE